VTTTGFAPSGLDEQDVPRFVSEEEYLRVWAEQHYEWVDGELIKVPSNDDHFSVQLYLLILLRQYLKYRPIARLVGAPFMMKFDPLNKRRYREPDIMLVMNENSAGIYTKTGVIGAADICIEIVSPESVVRDYSTKLFEYQSAGVREYWIIDPDHKAAVFHVRDADSHLVAASFTGSVYMTPLLPDLKIDLSVLWLEPHPSPDEIVDAVRAMLTDITE
jgi:Uma2 family endonuclease